jgi:site-specific DNA recombinase
LAAQSNGKVGLHNTVCFDTAPSSPYERKVMRLAFLAPDIQAAILEGRQPIGLIRQRLIAGEIPAAWADQRKLFNNL